MGLTGLYSLLYRFYTWAYRPPGPPRGVYEYVSPPLLVVLRDLILGDYALLYGAYVMLCDMDTPYHSNYMCGAAVDPPGDGNDCLLQLRLVAGIRGAQICFTVLVLSASSP